MANTTFNIQYEGETIPVTITETENGEDTLYMATLPDHEAFEIFLSEDDMWVSNDAPDLEEDLIFLIGDTFENLQS